MKNALHRKVNVQLNGLRLINTYIVDLFLAIFIHLGLFNLVVITFIYGLTRSIRTSPNLKWWMVDVTR